MEWGIKLQELHSELWPWLDPGSRLYYLNLLSALIITVLFLSLVRLKNSEKKSDSFLSLKTIKAHFKNYWFHPSAQVDYQIYALNALLKVFLFAPVLGLSLYISMYTIKGLYLISPDFEPRQGSVFLFFLATIFAFIWDDFLRFYHHYLMHKVNWMWQLHKTHHSAEVLTPITLFRTHPLESLQGTVRNSLSFGVSGGLFMFLFSGQVELTTLFGVNIFGFLFNSLSGNLRHSQIPISFGWFENVLISPKQHQIHHSNQVIHFNKNFGVALSCWDKMFGSFLRSENETIKGFGVSGVKSDHLLTVLWPWSMNLKFKNKSLSQPRNIKPSNSNLNKVF
jgi:sterol desaturase/sphingolipid hydroxylase (fatty acid hydroxylase superfamily)